MALQFVGGTSNTGTGASYTVSLSGTLTGGLASSPAQGDLILVFTGESNSGTVTSACSGNTYGAYPTIRAHQVQADTYDANLDSFYAFAGATPDTTLTITRGNNNTTYGSATVVHVWRGAHTTTPFNVTPTVAAAANASTANPPAIVPTTAGSMVIYCGVGTQTSTGTAFTTQGTYPVSAKGDGSTSDVDVMVSSYTAWTSGSYDPAAFAGSTTTTACGWVALTIALQPQPPTNYPLTCNSGSYTYSGSSATVARNRALTGNSGSYTYTGSDATLTKGAGLTHYTLTANSGSYTYAGQSAALVRGRPITASAGSYAYSGQSATLLRNRSLTASAGSYAYSGSSAAISRNRALVSSSGAYAYTGQSATLTKSAAATNYALTAQAGSYAYSGQSATLTKGAVATNYALTAQSGAYTLSGQAAPLLRGRNLLAQAGSYALTGQPATLLRSKLLTAGSGPYTYTGSSAILTHAAAVFPEFAAPRLIVAPSRPRQLSVHARTPTVAALSRTLTHEATQ